MWKSKKSIWQRIGEFAGLVAIIGVLVTLVQLSQSIGDSRSQASSQSTQIALLQEQLGIQQEIATLQVGASGAGPTSTAIAQRIIELESTRIALATKEAGIQHAESDQTMQIQAGTEWVSTGLIVSPGETVDIQYVSGKWRSVKNGIWVDGTDCSGPQPGAMIPSSNGNALIARIGIDGTPRCVGNSPFVSSDFGVLYLSQNDCPAGCFLDNEGSITVRIRVFK